ncbi:MAG: hypothetical protein WC490_00500 [Candidatus Margulisiibacteriota bacterium]
MIELWLEMLSKNAFLSFLLAALLLPVSSAFSSEVPVSLKADELRFDQESGIVRAKGSVSVKLNDLTVSAEALTLDTSRNIVTMEGAVSLKRGRLEALGSRAVYDPDTDVGLIFDFKTTVKHPRVKGDIFLSSQRVEDAALYKSGQEGQSTTCDLEHPHYYLKAKEFLFIPEEKIVGKSVTFYVNDTPLMWLPFYIYDLKKRRVSLMMPVFGSNHVEGDFMKNQLEYYIDEGASGSVFLDLMSKKGIGYGIDHYYLLDKKQSGDLFLYHVSENDTGIPAWVVKLKHELKFSEKTKASLGYEYSNIYLVPSGRLDQTQYKLGFEHSDDERAGQFNFSSLENRFSSLSDYSAHVRYSAGGADTSYSYNYRGGMTSPKWQNITQSLYHSRKLFSPNLDFKFNLNYYRAVTIEGSPFDDRLYPEAALSYRGPSYTFKLTESAYIDADADAFKGDEYVEYIEKLPEAVLTLDPADLWLFKLSTEFSYGRFHESKYLAPTKTQRHFTTGRYKASLGLGQTFALPLNSSLYVFGGADQFNYDTGDQRYLVKEDLSLKSEAGGFLSNTLTYSRAINDGNSPFFFDSKGADHHWLRDRVMFSDGTRQRFSIEGGYNYLVSKYYDLMLNYDASPSKEFHLNVSSGYDLENGRWRDMVSVLNMALLAGVLIDLTHSYDLNTGKTNNASDLIKLEIGDSWQSRWVVSIGQTYDPVLNKLALQEFSVVKDLHCWEAKFNYNDFRKESRVSFMLKAFPDQPIGFVSGSRGFFMEGLKQEEGRR